MKKQTINFSWPATLSDFTQDTVNENFSRGKLKVFYKGETADKRCFSDEFAEQVIKTLPYAPVVSSYDVEADDFVGHAEEQQIFGIVDPCVEPVFEVLEDGKTWCICDVVLYTERPDTTGKLASRIIGQPHSLELNPKTVKYVINYDEKKHFKNIEFTAGDFIGVSVLGKKQKPAFTGSAFFSCDEKFETKMNILREYCCASASAINGGEKEMDLEKFMELSWGEISTKVHAAVRSEYSDEASIYLIDMYDSYAIFSMFFYLEEKTRLIKIHYTCDELGTVTLGEVTEVYVEYKDVPAIVEQNMEQIDEETSIDAVEDEEATIVVEVAPEEQQPIVNENCNISDEEVLTEEPAQVLDVEITPQMEASVEDEQNTINEEAEADSSTTSLTESERAEFETLKREKKINLLNSYKKNLTDDEYQGFLDAIDTFSDDSLELELLKAYKRSQQESDSNKNPIRAFALAQVNNAKNESALDAFVVKYKR